jgi:predicted metalloprotease
MQLGNQRSSGNVEDRRGMGPVAIGGGLGIGGVILAIIASFMGIDPSVVLDTASQIAPQREQAPAPQRSGPPDEMQVFVSKVLGSTEDTWHQVFKQMNREYQDPKLVLFSGSTRSACGVGQSAMGPFYCPRDEKVYIDLAFYRDLRNRFKAPGDFAQAYVIAHEVGHHVQNQLGIMRKLESLQGRVSKGEFNQASVRVELQADCFAGVWAHNVGNRNLLDPGDLDEGLAAASAIGDDRLQKAAQGYVVPESFTHGSSAQRVRWFKRGMETGRMQDCDTFAAGSL